MTVFRTELRPTDVPRIEVAADATGFFSQEETAIARELAEEALAHGDASGYHFILAEDSAPPNRGGNSDQLLGFACFGPIPATQGSFDLYWIVIAPAAQRRGLGRRLLKAVEEAVVRQGGWQIYADTSSRPQYAPTRRFYEGTGFEQAALLEHFYAEGDGKVTFHKRLRVADRNR